MALNIAMITMDTNNDQQLLSFAAYVYIDAPTLPICPCDQVHNRFCYALDPGRPVRSGLHASIFNAEHVGYTVMCGTSDLRTARVQC